MNPAFPRLLILRHPHGLSDLHYLQQLRWTVVMPFPSSLPTLCTCFAYVGYVPVESGVT
jgi:hypothetical protein